MVLVKPEFGNNGGLTTHLFIGLLEKRVLYDMWFGSESRLWSVVSNYHSKFLIYLSTNSQTHQSALIKFPSGRKEIKHVQACKK
jgi:hypothetical protein